MPHRLVCVAILLAWAVAAWALIRRDVLPDWLVGPPPDLRAVIRAEEDAGPTRWAIQVADDPARPEDLHTVGQVLTESSRKPDGYVRLASSATIDSAGLLKGTPLAHQGGDPLDLVSSFDVDPSGNLFHFHTAVRPAGRRDDILTLEGMLRENAIEVRARSPLVPFLNWKQTFPYQARGMVQNAMGPAGRMPGLHVGQRWDSQVVNPLTGQVEIGRVEVVGRDHIYWDTASVDALVVVSKLSHLSARTWVRPDGLVLRQEVPTPFVRFYLERIVANPAVAGSPRPGAEAPVANPRDRSR